MSARYSRKSNLLAGGFLLAGVALAVVTSFVLADVNLVRTRNYVVRFSLRDGATGLAPDAAVRVGGQPEGKVRAVRVERDGPTGEYVVNVDIKLRADIELYEDAWAYLEVPLLGNVSSINIPFLGTGEEVTQAQGTGPRLEPGEVLKGSIAPPAFLANAGFGPAQRQQLQRIFTSAERSMHEIADALESLRPRVEPFADDVQATAASARRSAESMESSLESWRPRITNTLANAEEFTGRLSPMADDAKIVLADAREMIRSGRALVDDNRPRVDNILARTDEVVTGVRDNWIPRGSDAIEAARAGAETYTELGNELSRMIAEQGPGIERSLANLRIASDQLKFLAIEARSQPWRLLHRPDTKELENQLLYDSARSYAVAVSDLRAASEAMDALVARTSAGGAMDLSELKAMRDKLQQAFEHYSGAEAELLDRMIKANR